MATPELFNEADVLVASSKLDVERKSVKPKLGSKKRDVKNSSGHFTTESIPGELEFKLAVTVAADIDTAEGWIDQVVQIVGDNGCSWQSEGLTTTEVSAPDGGYATVKMAGKPFKSMS
jgi:hypothetical protein